MSIRETIARATVLASLGVCSWTLARPTPLSTAINYQGQLQQGGNPVNATADFQFTLFDALSGPNQIGSMVPVNNATVSSGNFTVPIDFGATAFDGNDRFLQIAVRSPAGSGSFTTLAPRQKLAATPYALQTRGIVTDAAGNVGIGTTTPVHPLHVAAPIPVLALQDSNGTTSQSGYVSFRDSANLETGYVGFGDETVPHLAIANFRSGGNLQFLTQSGQRMTITSAGNVGIGTTIPANRLSVVGGADFSGQVGIGTTTLAATLTVDGSMRILGFAPGEYLDYSFGRVAINLSGDGGFGATLISFRVNEAQQGSITVLGSNVSYNGFMGSHYAWMDGERSIDRGALVRMTGDNRRLNGSAESDVVYGIEPTASTNDPACLGAYLGIMESDKPADLANPHLIAAVGNGEMLVVDSGTGDIQPGDYLISSESTGCAMKDDPRRFPIGHIVARAAERVDWSTADSDSGGIKRRRISVFFESFVRDSEAAALAALVRDQQTRIQVLESQLHEAQGLADRVARLETASQFAIKEGGR